LQQFSCLKRLDTFILRSYLGPFILTFFIAVFILLMQFVWKYVDELVGKGLDWITILKLLGLVSTTMVGMALPLSILLSSLMAFGNLGEFMELTAIKSSGISLQRAMRPLFILCILLSGLAFYFSNNILPVANLKMRTLLNDIRDKRPELNIKPGIFNSDLQDYVIRIGKKSRDGKVLEEIMIYDHSRRSGNERLIVAEKAIVGLSEDKRYLEFRLINGHSYTEAEWGKKRSGNFPFLRENFAEDVIRFDRLMFSLPKTDESIFKKNYQMLNLIQLSHARDTLQGELDKEKAQLIRQLFRSPFFDRDESYATDRRTDHGNLMTSKIKKVESAALPIKDSGNISLLGKMLDSAGLAMDRVRPLNSQPKKLNTNNLLLNFSRHERNKIMEAASNALRSHKSTLEFTIKNLEEQQERIHRHEIEWHRKFTLSAACMVLFLIGAPLGAIVRKGGLGMPVVISLIFFITYYMISITGEKLAREGVLSAFNGMWLSTYILLPMGIFLTWKATHDSPLFDRESYSRFFRRVFSFLGTGRKIKHS
jgi:lipopolysaccharide export system permease protein